MSVIDSITNTTRTAFSFEVLPPLKGTGIDSLFHTIDELREFDPKYINITTHRSEYVYQESPEGVFHKVSLRRRPGTVAVAAAIKNRYDIPVVPHILCSGFTREETEYVLLDLQFLGITLIKLCPTFFTLFYPLFRFGLPRSLGLCTQSFLFRLLLCLDFLRSKHNLGSQGISRSFHDIERIGNRQTI